MLQYLLKLLKKLFFIDDSPSSAEGILEKRVIEKEKELKNIQEKKENIDEKASVDDNIEYFNKRK